MADVSVQMGVSGLSQFKTAMTQAQTSVKTLDQQLKANESQLKATGDAEVYMTNKAGLLQKQLKEQKSVVANANKALDEMRSQGLDSTNKEFAKMEQTLAKAMAKMFDIQTAINEVGTESLEAAGKTEQLSESLGGLNKKVSLDQVIRGIDSITGGMEKAARKAVDLGKAIWENITDSARWADDTATQAMILNMDVEEYQRYKKVFDTVGELTVQEWQKAKLKVQKAINDPTQDQTDILALLGIKTHEGQQGKYGWVEGAARNFEDVFWDIGETLRKKVASGEMTQDLADTYANELFGRGFDELNPMFALGKTGFEEALKAQTVASEEAIQKNAELNDKLIDLKGDFESLKQEVLGGIAPALTKASEVLDGLLSKLIEYLKSPDGQQALEDMGKAVEGLFSDLSNIDPEQVIEGFAGIFDKIVSGLQWLENNSGAVIGAMKAIVDGWAALKITDGALKILQLVQGIHGLTGGSAAASAAGKAAGASWGSGFASAVMAAAPWLIGIYTLLNPAETGDDGFRPEVDETGAATQYGMEKLKSMYANPNLTDEQKGMTQWDPAWEVVPFVADVFGQMSDILNDPMAAGAILRFGDDITGLVEALEGLGYEKNMTEDQYSDYMKTRRERSITDEEEIAAQQGAVDAMNTASETMAGLPDAVAEAVGNVKLQVLWPFGSHANGINYVPFDGYSAILHKGERVVPAREVGSSRNFSSNLYVESMYMNNGTDAEGLAAAMAAANRRTMRGFGS